MSEKKSNQAKLESLLGYNPNAGVKGGSGLLAEVQKELKEENDKKAKEQARALVKQAIELNSKFQETRKNFLSAEKKFDKELGKLLNRIENLGNGGSGQESIEEES